MTKDQIELLRPGFEAAIIDRFKESGFLEVEIRVECLSRCGDSYNDPQVAIAWWSWTQSRESLVVELPTVQDVNIEEYTACSTIEACKQAIIAAGGTVKS